MSVTREYQHTVTGPEQLLQALIVNDQAIAVNATNYWEVEIRAYLGDDVLGETVAKFSTAVYRLDAKIPSPMYDGSGADFIPRKFVAGDRLGTLVTSFGSAETTLPLKNLRVLPEFQRNVR